MKKFTTAETRDLFGQVLMGEISLSRMVEILNEMVGEEEEPVCKFKKGDKVRIKDGFKPEEHRGRASFVREMDKYIGKDFYVDRVEGSYIISDGWAFDPDWLEPYVEELKEGDIAIFWDSDQSQARICVYNQFRNDTFYPHVDHIGNRFKNAVKFESREQFERLIKGEI